MDHFVAAAAVPDGVWEGQRLNRVAFPIGGIGAGMFCLEGPGSGLCRLPDSYAAPHREVLGVLAQTAGPGPVASKETPLTPPHQSPPRPQQHPAADASTF